MNNWSFCLLWTQQRFLNSQLWPSSVMAFIILASLDLQSSLPQGTQVNYWVWPNVFWGSLITSLKNSWVSWNVFLGHCHLGRLSQVGYFHPGNTKPHIIYLWLISSLFLIIPKSYIPLKAPPHWSPFSYPFALTFSLIRLMRELPLLLLSLNSLRPTNLLSMAKKAEAREELQ